jgi:H/ACA ribonucleoprotein complex subunit 3
MKIKRCKECSVYTFKDACPACGGATSSPHPPRFSPEDRYGVYRRKLKMQAYKRRENV